MARLTRIEGRQGQRLYAEFDDGVRGEVDLSDRLFGPMFEPLRDPHVFASVALDEFGVPTWPNGADVAPDGVYRELRQQSASKQLGKP